MRVKGLAIRRRLRERRRVAEFNRQVALLNAIVDGHDRQTSWTTPSIHSIWDMTRH